MKNSRRLRLCLLFFLVAISLHAQRKPIWAEDGKSNVVLSGKTLTSQRIYKLDFSSLKNNVSGTVSRKQYLAGRKGTTIQFPLPDGTFGTFEVAENSVLSPELRAKYPDIKSYSGSTAGDSSNTIHFSVDVFGFHGMMNYRGKVYYINPVQEGSDRFYMAAKTEFGTKDFQCSFEDTKEISEQLKETVGRKDQTVNDGNLRTYRLALACTGEYANYHINAAGLSGGTVSQKKAAVLAAMNVTMTRVNGIFERDLSVTMEIIPTNENIIFLDPDTDGMTNDDGDALIEEIQNIVNTNVGVSNYDIGHVFSTGGGGIARLNSPCTSNKARGVTGLPNPVGDAFAIDFVAHEMGHQYGATHTYNNSCGGQRTSSTAVEPGSGSTIMSYAGICAPNIQGSSDDYFHSVSIAQMWANITAGNSTCAALTATGNNAPIASAGTDYVIPAGTAFVLEATATDSDGDALTYNWEQLDNQITVQPPAANATGGPVFRSRPSSTSPRRYFPQTSDILSNNLAPNYEVVPTVSRDLNFSLLVRDNNSAGGQTARDLMKVTVADVAGPFVVTSQNSAQIITAGDVETITWNVANTNLAPVNTSLVNVYLITNGNFENKILLEENTPNDGSTDVVIPGGFATTNARIMVQAVDNIFFAINTATLQIVESEFLLDFASLEYDVCQGDDLVINFTYESFSGFSETVNLTATGLPAGVTALFSPTSVSSDGAPVTLTLSGTASASVGPNEFDVVANGSTVNKSYPVTMNVFNTTFQPIVLNSPANNEEEVKFNHVFTWSSDTNAKQYEIQISEQSDFSSISETAIVNVNSYTGQNLQSLTTYFWRIKSINQCGESAFSAANTFTTIEVNCGNYSNGTDFPISSTGANTVTSTINVFEDGSIFDLKVTVNINHTFAGDLSISLTSPQGTTVRLLDQVCDDSQNINATFTDSGVALICGTNPAVSGMVIPLDALSILKNESSYGLWTLTVTDNFNLDGGTLTNFGLEICVEGPFRPDTDQDGVFDDLDLCPGTPAGSKVDVNGCELFSLPADNFTVKTIGESCRENNDGSVVITANQILDYTATLTGNGVNSSVTFANGVEFNNLAAGDYTVCFTVDGEPDYEQCFDVSITEPESLSVFAKVDNLNKALELDLAGGDLYNVELNGITTQTSASKITLSLAKGINVLKVYTDKECQGVYEKSFFIEGEGAVYPNPFNNTVTVYVGVQNTSVKLSGYSVLGQKVFETQADSDDKGELLLDLGYLPSGMYFIQVKGTNLSTTHKVIKL